MLYQLLGPLQLDNAMVSFRDAFEGRQSPPGVSVTPVAGFIGTIEWLEDLCRLLGAASCAFSRIGLHGSLPC